MKRSLIVFIAACFILPNIFSQPLWMYSELNSGVSTNLTSASSNSLNNFNNAQVWICGNNGVVLKSTNNGDSFSNLTGNGIPVNVNLLTICIIGADTALTAGNNGTTTFLYRTINGGTNWTQVFTQQNGTINAIAFRNSFTGYITGNPVGGRWSVWKTINKGQTWDSTGMYIPQTASETGFPNSIAARHNYVMFGTNNRKIYRSTNYGINWSAITTPEINSTSVWMYTDTTLYTFMYSGGHRINRSTNLGVNWTESTSPDTLFNIVGFAPGVFGVYDNMPMGNYACRNNNKIYFTNFGVGSFFAEYTAPSGTYNHMSCDYFQNYMQIGYSFAVRNNGGITRVWYFRGGGIKQLSALLPDKFELYQNYPNPFNPVTNIRFAVKSFGLVQLAVYDETGKEVFKPVNELMKPGTYEVNWDASSFASGIYFYRIVTDGYMETRKMIIVK